MNNAMFYVLTKFPKKGNLVFLIKNLNNLGIKLVLFDSVFWHP